MVESNITWSVHAIPYWLDLNFADRKYRIGHYGRQRAVRRLCINFTQFHLGNGSVKESWWMVPSWYNFFWRQIDFLNLNGIPVHVGLPKDISVSIPLLWMRSDKPLLNSPIQRFVNSYVTCNETLSWLFGRRYVGAELLRKLLSWMVLRCFNLLDTRKFFVCRIWC